MSRKILLQLFILFIATVVNSQTVPLDSLPSWQSHLQESSNGLAWGDVDGDGDLDLACAKSGRNWDWGAPNEVYLNINGVLETTPSWTSTESDVTMSVAWGDVDGDGDLDLACGNRHPRFTEPIGRPNRVYLNVGGVLERTASWSSVEYGTTFSVAWGDVDSDGDLDLACGNNFDDPEATVGQRNHIYFNHNGVLDSVAGWASMDRAGTYSIAWADVDGDGYLELAAGNHLNENSDRVYDNNGGNLEHLASWISKENEQTWCIAWGDADNDGDLDLACGSRYFPTTDPQKRVRIYFNHEGVLEDSASWLSAEDIFATSLCWGDVDGDGDQDLAVTSQQAYGDPEGIALRVFLQRDGVLDTAATWVSRVNDDHYGYVAYSSAWGDVDNDGDLDLAMGAIQDPTVLLLNHSSPVDDSTGWISGDDLSAMDMVLGDMDNDGDLDLVSGNWGQRNTVHYNTDGMLETWPRWYSDDKYWLYSIDLGDVNRDGYLDLIRSGGDWNYPAKNWLYYNLNGTLRTSPSWSTPVAEENTVVKFGDVDGDGDLDLACGTWHHNQNRLYLNNGINGGRLEPESSWSNLDNEHKITWDMAWGDVDNDGDLDLACANRDTLTLHEGFNVIYYNHNGVLEDSASWIASENDVTHSLAWGDVDGDGDLDLACGNTHGPNRVYINYSGRLETTASWTSVAGDFTTNVQWVDIDMDGDLDLATANGYSAPAPNRVYINHAGVLENRASWESPSDNTWGMAVGDIDGDGDPDLVYGNYRSKKNAYLSRAVKPRTNLTLPNTPPRLDQLHIVNVDSNANRVTFGFNLVDYQSDLCDLVAIDFSTLGGGNWRPATIMGDTKRLNSSPTGDYYELIWDAEVDGADGYDAKLRINVASNPDRLGLIQWPALTSMVDVGRIDGRPRIALLYPNQGSPVIDSMSIIGQIWDATNFSDCRILMGQLPDTLLWEEIFFAAEPVPYNGHITTFDLADKAPGEYIVRTIAADRRGAQAVTDKHITLFEKQTGSPSVISAFPPPGATNIPGNAPVVIGFDRDINQPAIDNESFNLISETGERYTDALYEYSSRTLTIKPESAYEEDRFHYAIANSRLRSRQGVDMGGEFVLSFRTSLAAPTTEIDSLTPFRGQIQTPVDIDSISVHFRNQSAFKYITVFSIDGDTILADALPAGLLDASLPIFGLIPKTYYIVRLSDSPDFDGPSDYMSYFVTEDTELPLVVNFEPKNEAWLVRVDEKPVVRFNKQINSFTVDDNSCYLTGAEGKLSCAYEFSGDSTTTVTLSPDQPLIANSYYTLTLTSHIQDHIGNHLTGMSWSFTTGAFDTIGYDGGVMESGMVSLKFPTGSLTGEQEIGIGIIPEGQLAVNQRYNYTGLAVDIEPNIALNRSAVLSLKLPAEIISSAGNASDLKFYRQDEMTDAWEYVGGSNESENLSVSINKLGRYAVFSGSFGSLQGETLSNLILSPRIVRPQSGEADNELVVSYDLASTASVEIRIYNTAGRLMALLPSPGDPGTNLVRWDGRDSGGDFVTDGLYVLMLEAGNKKTQKTFVVMKK